jgi:hypothetical protein
LQAQHACQLVRLTEYRGIRRRYSNNVKSELQVIERMVTMSRLVKAVRSRREINRTRRELNRAIANATTPAMRDELILVAQRGGNVW